MPEEKVTFEAWMLDKIPDYSADKMELFMKAYNDAKIELFLSKDREYGGSWMQDGILGAYLNLKRKIDRILTRFKRGLLFQFTDVDNVGESSLDTFMDMENYSAMNVGFLFLCCKDKAVFDMYCKKAPKLSNVFEFDSETKTVKLKSDEPSNSSQTAQ